MRQSKSTYNARYRAQPKGKRAQARARRNWQCKKKYGVTLAERERMYQTQSGLCGLCQKPLPKAVMCNDCDLDHNHVTGQVRALVHRKCNLLIGHVECSGHLVSAAIAYLDHYSRV